MKNIYIINFPSEEEVEKWITEQNYASNNPIIVSYVEGLRDCAKWFRSQVRDVELKSILRHYENYKAENSLNNCGRTYESIIDYYLSGKGKEGE